MIKKEEQGMKWMENWKQNTRRAAALVLGTVLVIGNMGVVSYAEEGSKAESVVGYSDALVEKVNNLSTVITYTAFQKMSTEEKKATKEIKIGTAQELWDFSEDFSTVYEVVNGYDGKTIYLDNDIKMDDINQIPMSPIGYYNNANSHKTFKGTFDGQGHEVDVIIDSSGCNGVGLFGAMGNGSIKNLIFSGSVVGGQNQIGGIVGLISGGPVNIQNCCNKANVTTTSSTGTYVGGIVGFINGGTGHTISHCTNEGNISAIRSMGGIAGGINSNTTITNCRNLGEVKAADWNVTTSQTAYGCGGIVGILKNNPTTITKCTNDGAVHSQGCTAAGIVGNVQVKGCKLSEVYNYGVVTNSAADGFANPIYGSSTGNFGLLENEINVVNSTNPTGEDSALTNAAIEADTSIVSVTKDIVGYSDARVVGVDLTNVISMTDYLAATDTSGIREVKISTAKELQDFVSNCTSKSGYLGLTIYLANDIDMTGQSMASSGTAFQGTFDGQGYEIAGLSIARTDAGTGLFRYAASGAIIRNLILSGTVGGVSQVGSIVGNINAGQVTIENCYNKTAVTGTGTYVGGIVGLVTNKSGVKVTITNCTNKGAVQSKSDVGGIVGGTLYTTTVKNCRNAGTVKATGGSATNGCGGIVGTIKNQTTTITGCINNGIITKGSCATMQDTSYGYKASGTASVTDMSDYSSDNTVDASYEVAAIYADTLIGTNAGTNRKEVASITKDIVGYSDARVEYVDLSQVMDFTTYKALDDKSNVTKVKVCTEQELIDLRAYFGDSKVGYNPEMTIYLANDIKMTKSMAPIGTAGSHFKGIFDGQGHEISNFTINNTNTDRGLFGYVDEAVIKNLVLSGSIQGGERTGGIVAYVYDGNVTIENCYNKASVTSSAAYAGGIAGIVRSVAGVSLTVSNCTNTGAITATADIGGLVGGALNTTSIANSRNIGTVTATAGTTANGCGGLAGIVKNQAVTIAGAINNGTVNTGACTGAGVIGTIEKVKGSSIADTTNYGAVTAGTDGKASAVYGMATGSYVIEDSYATYDKTDETDAGMTAAIAEGTKHTGWTMGDANDDGNLDVRDLVRIKRYAKEPGSVEIKNLSCADTSRDNAVTDADAGACRIILLKQIFYAKDLEGLTVNALGDSYFAGAGLPQDQVWLHLMARKYGMTMNNYGIGGSTVSDSKDGYYNPMVGRYTDLIKANNNPDIILVEGGRNDFNYKAEPGEISIDNVDKTTYVGALNLIIDGLQEAYPNAMIVCVTPWNFPDKDGYEYNYLDYCNAMVQVAEMQGVKCIKAYDPEISGVDMRVDGFSAQYTVDGGVSHLNLKGMKIVMPRFEKLLAEYWEEFNHEKQ